MDTQKLRQRILDLAIRGKLVPQDPNDEPASVLLDRIRAEKERLIAEGKIKRPKAKKSSDKSHYQNFTPPFDIPESWQWVTIADICSKIGSGSTPKGSNYSFDGIPFFRSQNVYNEGLVYADIKYISEEIHQSMIGTEVNAGDLLLNITGGSLGRCAVVPEEFAQGNVSQHVCILRPIFVHPQYFHCFILSSDFAKAMNLTGSGREGLPKYNLEVMNFPLPPIKEQERIVATIQIFQDILNLLDSSRVSLIDGITKAKSKILDLAMQGKLVPQDPGDEPAADLLRRINPKARIITDNPQCRNLQSGWTLCQLRNLCSFLSRGKSPKYSETPNQYPVFAQKCNLKDGDISLSQARFLDEITISKWPDKYRLKEGDVLVNSTGTGTVGRTRLFKEKYLGHYPFAVPDSHVSVVRTFDDIDSTYIFYCLYCQAGQQHFAENLAGSTNQKELYIDVIGDMIIKLPPTNEQKRIVAKIKELYTVFDEIESSLQS